VEIGEGKLSGAEEEEEAEKEEEEEEEEEGWGEGGFWPGDGIDGGVGGNWVEWQQHCFKQRRERD